MIHSWWPRTPRPGNFGDILTPYLVAKLTGRAPIHVDCLTLKSYRNNLLCVGSIIKYADPGVNVWGSGLMRLADEPSPRAIYHAVRGPITRQRILELGGSCPEVYGDPALLLPTFYKGTLVKKYRFGVIPHYVDYALVSEWFKGIDDILVINLLDPNIENVVDRITECETVISSSLHGIIAAHAYGVSAAWVKFSDKLKGDGTKFRDYFASVGVSMECIDVKKPMTPSDLRTMEYVGNIQYDPLNLIEAFPYARS